MQGLWPLPERPKIAKNRHISRYNKKTKPLLFRKVWFILLVKAEGREIQRLFKKQVCGRVCQVYEPMVPALGPKSVPAGRLHGLYTTCLAHAGLRMNGLMLKDISQGSMPGSNTDAGLDAGTVQLGAVPAGGAIPPLSMVKNGDTICSLRTRYFCLRQG